MDITSSRRNQLLTAIALFVVSLLGSFVLSPSLPWGAVRLLVKSAPIFPAILLGYQITRTVTELDELQQRVQLEAIAFSWANTILFTFVVDTMFQMQEISMIWVLPIAIIFWRLGLNMAKQRYQ